MSYTLSLFAAIAVQKKPATKLLFKALQKSLKKNYNDKKQV